MTVQTKYHVTADQLDREHDEIRRAKEDPARFEVLYNRYHEQIFRYVYQRVDSTEIAFDVTSQVFLKAMNNLHRYEYRGVPFSSWLYRIASNELKDAFKKEKASRTINIESTNVYDIIDEMEENPLAQYHDAMIEAVANLPEEDLQLIEMRFFEKRSFKEIADIVGITENNAKVKVYRILGRLKTIVTNKSK